MLLPLSRACRGFGPLPDRSRVCRDRRDAQGLTETEDDRSGPDSDVCTTVIAIVLRPVDITPADAAKPSHGSSALSNSPQLPIAPRWGCRRDWFLRARL